MSKQKYQAYPHDIQQLRISPHRKVGFELAHYIVRDGKALFQYPYPRSTILTPSQVRVMLNLLKEAYCIGDFEEADVELIELCRIPKSQERQQVLHKLSEVGSIDWAVLEEDILSIHDLLMEIANE